MPPNEYAHLAEELSALRDEVADLRKETMRIIKAVCGDLEEQQPGILPRLRDLESRAKAQDKAWWLVVGAAITSFAAAAASIFYGFFHRSG